MFSNKDAMRMNSAALVLICPSCVAMKSFIKGDGFDVLSQVHAT